jgi:hypothetical protein
MDVQTTIDTLEKITLVPVLIVGIVTVWRAYQTCLSMHETVKSLQAQIDILHEHVLTLK